jgi:CrcB protein
VITALVLLGGGLGAALRYVVEQALGREAAWPRGTFAVNVTGCLALGLLLGLAPSNDVTTVLGTGVIGAYTTFSAYAVEVVKVDAERARASAVAYALGSVGLGVLAAALGLGLGRWLGHLGHGH